MSCFLYLVVAFILIGDYCDIFLIGYLYDANLSSHSLQYIVFFFPLSEYEYEGLREETSSDPSSIACNYKSTESALSGS